MSAIAMANVLGGNWKVYGVALAFGKVPVPVVQEEREQAVFESRAPRRVRVLIQVRYNDVVGVGIGDMTFIDGGNARETVWVVAV